MAFLFSLGYMEGVADRAVVDADSFVPDVLSRMILPHLLAAVEAAWSFAFHGIAFQSLLALHSRQRHQKGS
jgi:hypothetical protein